MAVLSRVRAFHVVLAVLLAGARFSAAAPPSGAAAGTEVLASRIAALEAALAEQGRQLDSLRQQLAAVEAAESEARAIAAPAADEATREPDEDATRHGLYLPSRSWAGGDLNYGAPGLSLETHGFVDLEFVDPGPGGSRSGNSTFDSHHANVFFDSRLRPNLRGHVEIEYEHSGEEVEIDQAFVRWAIADELMLQAGRFYTPFGVERFVWYSPTNALISRPEPLRQIVPGNFYAQGLMALGTFGGDGRVRFTYEAAVSDGLGDAAAFDRRGSRQSRNNNSERAWSGRGGFVVWPWVEVGASYHGQKYSDDGRLGLRFLGADLSARWRGLELRTEYVDARVDLDGSAGGTPARAADLRQHGWYLQLGYAFGWEREFLNQLMLVGRYDSVDLDESISGPDDRRFWSIGGNLRVYDHFRVKLELRLARENGPRRDDDAFLSQAVFDF